jgi:benzoate/toluate 1,2-dioxygenase reductase subunit
MGYKPARHTLWVTGRRWLCPRTFEVCFNRPPGFDFTPGQKIRFLMGEISRDYTLVNGPGDTAVVICVRLVPQGRFTPVLAAARPGDRFEIEGPSGYFTCQPSQRRRVFVATGTGIAPFVSFARGGVRDFICLHGVRDPGELYYREVIAPAAGLYQPCLSGEEGKDLPPERFCGRVTRYLIDHLTPGAFDFYLCGRAGMIEESVHIIDERFKGSRVFTEIFH